MVLFRNYFNNKKYRVLQPLVAAQIGLGKRASKWKEIPMQRALIFKHV